MTNSLASRRMRLLCGCAGFTLAVAGGSVALAQSSPDAGGVQPGPGQLTEQVSPQEPAQPSPPTRREAAEDAANGGDTEVEALVVSGYRAAVERSIELKRESDLVVETVSAEDIGKLPDNSIAEAIARLPGLTAQRLDGRAQTISIRGLSSDFSTTLLNGREQVTAGDNRGVEFDQYPSEVINAVVVYKTPDASIVGQGLSGTVDLRTIRPIEFGRRAVQVGARAEMLDLGKLNSDSKDTGFRINGTYVDQFANDTIGVALGVAYMQSPTQIERFNSWGYPTINAQGDVVLGGAKPYVVSSNLERLGVMGAIEYAPTDNFTTTLDVFYSSFNDEQTLRGIELPLWWGGRPLEPGFTVQNGVVTQGQFNGVKGVVRNDANTRDADIYAVGWNGRWHSDAWTMIGDISYSKVNRTDQIIETYSGTGRGPLGATDNLAFTFDPGRGAVFNSQLDYADPTLIQLTSPQGWGGDVVPGGQDGYYNNPSISDELLAFRASAERELGGAFRSIEFGANYTTRSKDYVPDEFFLGLVANANDPTHTTSVPIPSEFLLDPTPLDFLGIAGMVSYDPLRLLNSGIYNLRRNPNADVATKAWEVSEDVLTGYAKLNIDTEVGAARLTGNVGLQVVYTDQFSKGSGATGTGTPIPLDNGISYTEWLPSMNLSFRFPEDHVIRISASRQMARTRMDDMRASVNFGYDPAKETCPDVNVCSPWSGSGGNPLLKPIIAKAIDVTYEKYFGNQAYFSIGAFYKHLDSFVARTNSLYDFTGFPVPPGQNPVLHQGLVNIPVNLSGGYIQGIETAVSLPGDIISPMLDGFGAQLSYSYTDSSISPDPTQPAITVPGLSTSVANLIVYYEKYGWSARTSVRYRSDFLGEVAGFGNGRTYRQADAETIVDAQLGYTFSQGTLEGLSILLQGNNLSNEPFITWESETSQRVIDYNNFGRRFLLGFSYKF
ncbi:MAG TPA: TonB-dependent receptor [Caulobacteraceae bacterium]|jgi:iron complex outermembrane receptor protein